MISIRLIQREDFDVWLPLWQGYLDFYEVEISDEVTRFTFDRLNVPGTSMFGALAVTETGAEVGLVHWLTHPGTWSKQDSCYLEDLFVDSLFRGHGAGRALIAYVKEWAVTEQSARVYWLTAESNVSAQKLYDRVAEKTGFIQYQIPIER
jgi:GNAT superfamily N-acetyltransferase